MYRSPEQIAGRLNLDSGRKTISGEAIYQYIYLDNPSFNRYLRYQKGRYRRKRSTLLMEKQREEAKKRRIDLRPEVVNRRERLGGWEGDTVVGTKQSGSILTHVERRSG